MAKGKKYPDSVKEKAYMTYLTCNNVNETARKMKIPYSTVAQWIKNKDVDPKYDKLRDEKKREFIDKSTEIIDAGLALLERRFRRALEQEKEIDQIIDEIFTDNDIEITTKQRQRLLSKIEELKLQNIKDITIAIGTLFDKRAIAKENESEDSDTSIRVTLDWKR